MQKVLSVEHGKFILTEGHSRRTVEIKEAVQFKELADDKARQSLSRWLNPRFNLPLAPLPPFLDSHQKEGVKWILSRGRSYLAHAPGAGKTLQALTAALWTEGPGQIVFIVPPQLTRNWVNEIEKWKSKLIILPQLTTAVVPISEDAQLMDWHADILIVPSSMTTKEWVLYHLIAAKKKFVAVDEASQFKESSAQRTIALFGGVLNTKVKTRGILSGAKHAVLMDGSPLMNRPMELWAPLYALCPEAIDFMDQQEFGFRYCGPTMNAFGRWEFKRSSHEELLGDKIKSAFMHVVREEELHHPERLRSILFMSEDPRTPNERYWEQSLVRNLKMSDVSEDTSQGQLAQARHKLGMKKTKWIAEYVKSRLEKDESVLLFAWHREVCFELEKLLRKYTPGLVVGGTKESTRELIFSQFQSGKIKLIIGNISAMGRGHNLQRAHRVVFGEYSWTDELNKQCEKRASRKGSHHSMVRCDYIVCPDSLDEIVANGLFVKERRVKRTI